MARTDNLTNYLTDVASAIKTKKGSSTPIQAINFDTEIDNIETIDYGYKNSLTNTLGDYNAGNNPFTNVASARRCLYSYIIKKIPKMSIDFSSYSSIVGIFQYCFGLEEIDISQWNIGSINYFKSMFFACNSLKEIDFSKWNTLTGTTPTSTTDSINGIVKGCTSLKKANLSCFAGAWNIGGLVCGCTSLEHLDIRRLDLTTCTNVKENNQDFLGSSASASSQGGRVPTTCEIIVADATQKTYMATEFPSYTNVKTVAEYEAE